MKTTTDFCCNGLSSLHGPHANLASPVLWQGAPQVRQGTHHTVRGKAGSTKAAQPPTRCTAGRAAPLPGGCGRQRPERRPRPCLVSFVTTTVAGNACHYLPLTPKGNLSIPPPCTRLRSVDRNSELAGWVAGSPHRCAVTRGHGALLLLPYPLPALSASPRCIARAALCPAPRRSFHHSAHRDTRQTLLNTILR